MPALIHQDGKEITSRSELDCEVVVIGSGPAGATVARHLARAGASVVVIEEGPFVPPDQLPEDGFSAMARLYRDLGASLLMGRSPTPFIQGRVVGGTSVINGAISWRLPPDVLAEWITADPALEETLQTERLEAIQDEIEQDLKIAPTDPRIAGAKNHLLALGAEALKVAHRPIARNVDGCEGLGRCLQGCPLGRKLSMDRAYLPDAVGSGARIVCSARAVMIRREKGRAAGVFCRTAGGGSLDVRARRAVVLAASAVQSPMLLQMSGIHCGPVGDHFQCHPGVSVAGRFLEPVRIWAGATQGHEVTGYREEGIKLEVLGYDLGLIAGRLKGFGRDLSKDIADLAAFAHWGAAIRARASGRVRAGRSRANVRFDLLPEDLVRVRRSVRIMGEMMLAAGAEYVTPGVFGWHSKVSDRKVMARFEEEGPTDPRAYSLAVTHMFGTCRMGSDPHRSVVRPDFRHHHVEGLYLADSSVFPSNLGVNPQTSIIALARLCAERVVGA